MSIIIEKAQGVGTRAIQQDTCDWYADPEGKRGTIAVLSDGIGGMANGEKYSQLAVEEMLDSFKHSDPQEDMCDVLLNAYKTARRKAMSDNPDGGATVVALLIRKGRCAFLSVGDSRIVLLRKGSLIPLNRPQTLGAQLDVSAALGYITDVEASYNRMRGALINHLCVEDDKPCDRCLEPFRLVVSDKLALLSDGAFNALSEAELTACMRQTGVQGVKRMIECIKAKNEPRQDNYSVMMLAFQKNRKKK